MLSDNNCQILNTTQINQFNKSGRGRMFDAVLAENIGIITAIVFGQIQILHDSLIRNNSNKIDKDGWFECSNSYLSRMTTLENDAVKKHTKKLKEANIIQVKTIPGHPNLYRLVENINEWNLEKILKKRKRQKLWGDDYLGDEVNITVGASDDYLGDAVIVTGGSPQPNRLTDSRVCEPNSGPLRYLKVFKGKKKVNMDVAALPPTSAVANLNKKTTNKNTNTPSNELDGSFTPKNKNKKQHPNNHPNITPEHKPKVNTAQNIVKDLPAPPLAPMARKGRRTTVPGQISVRKYTMQEEQFAQKFYESVCVCYPKYMKDKTWERVRSPWCMYLHKACTEFGGFELVSKAITWAIDEYDNDIFRQNVRSLARLYKPWNGGKLINAIISQYLDVCIGKTKRKKPTPKNIWHLAYYTFLKKDMNKQQAIVLSDEFTNTMMTFHETIEVLYDDWENENKRQINHDWLYTSSFLYKAHELLHECYKNDLLEKLSDIINNYINNLCDEIDAGNVTWLKRDLFEPQTIMEDFSNG